MNEYFHEFTSILVNKANLVCNLFLVYLSISTTMCPSSVETTIFMGHVVLVILKHVYTFKITRSTKHKTYWYLHLGCNVWLSGHTNLPPG